MLAIYVMLFKFLLREALSRFVTNLGFWYTIRIYGLIWKKLNLLLWIIRNDIVIQGDPYGNLFLISKGACMKKGAIIKELFSFLKPPLSNYGDMVYELHVLIKLRNPPNPFGTPCRAIFSRSDSRSSAQMELQIK